LDPKAYSNGYVQTTETHLSLKSNIFYAAGGILANFLTFIVTYVVFLKCQVSTSTTTLLHFVICTFSAIFSYLNLETSSLNLIPEFPNDGWHIFKLFKLKYLSSKEFIYIVNVKKRTISLKYDGKEEIFDANEISFAKTMKSVSLIFLILVSSLTILLLFHKTFM